MAIKTSHLSPTTDAFKNFIIVNSTVATQPIKDLQIRDPTKPNLTNRNPRMDPTPDQLCILAVWAFVGY